jgi:hypothetical protein
VKRGWLLVVLLLSLGVNLGLVGSLLARRTGPERWQSDRPAEGRRPEALGRRLADRLELEPDERERFVAIQRSLFERTTEGRREITRIRRELRREVLLSEPDRPRLDALLEDLAHEEAALNRAFVAAVLESREVLGERRAAAYLRFLERFAPGRGGQGREGRSMRRPGGRRP